MRALLLDSSVLIRLLSASDEALQGRIDARLRGADQFALATSAINVLEVDTGLASKAPERKAHFAALLGALVVYPITAKTAVIAADLTPLARAHHHARAGLTADLLVLASAKEHAATLVTDDQNLLDLARIFEVEAIRSGDL